LKEAEGPERWRKHINPALFRQLLANGIAIMGSRRYLFELWQPASRLLRNEAKSSSSRRIFQTGGRRAKSSSTRASRIPPPRRTVQIAAFTGGTAFSVLVGTQLFHSTKEKEEAEDISPEGKKNYFRLAEVKLHDGSSERPWVTKGTSVYDITNWVGAHPGGDVILRAAGGSIDPYWNIFTIHKRQDIYDILEQYKIGEIDPKDLIDGSAPQDLIVDPFLTDPERDSRLITHTACPRNAETPSTGLTDFLTPTPLFYVRNHMWVPSVPLSHTVTIELPDGTEKVYSMDDLRTRFPTHKITATLQCAGNRRSDMTKHAGSTAGLQWTAGAISSAEWEGVKLRDVLADAGLDVANPGDEAKHAQFMGLEAYGASIPMSKAIDPHGDVLLAFRMNGQELPRDHGFPLRVVVPGVVAARSVKWLRKIVVSDEESESQWQRRDYKSFGPNVRSNPDWSKAKSIQEMPITSAITYISNPSNPSDAKPEISAPLQVEGYAYSGGGREIIRVDISMDNGRTWDQAELLDDAGKGSKAWCWKRWRYEGLKREGKTTVLVKATDEAYNTQPESYDAIWNARGNLATAWHRIEIGGEGEGVVGSGK
jgi:sulfite oxidase